MSDLLLIQSIGDDHQDTFAKYMTLEEPVHRAYAEQCGADYEHFVGYKDDRSNPTWNRIAMMIAAFDRGYRKVVWLDADTLVVDPDQNIFEETSDTAPLLMTRVDGAHVDMPWEYDPPLRKDGLCAALPSPPDGEHLCVLLREDYGAPEAEQLAGTKTFHAGPHECGDYVWPQWDVYNDGVLIVNDDEDAHARQALTFAWENRHSKFRPWHVPGMPELDWLLDYVFHFPDAVERLDDRWNCMGYEHRTPRSESAIWAWHGIPGPQRWAAFKAAYDEFYG